MSVWTVRLYGLSFWGMDTLRGAAPFMGKGGGISPGGDWICPFTIDGRRPGCEDDRLRDVGPPPVADEDDELEVNEIADAFGNEVDASDTLDSVGEDVSELAGADIFERRW